MATNVTVRDLVNYPDNNKTVTVDQSMIVPAGAEGDEKWVLSFTTNGYSDNTNRTPIQDIYLQDTRVGWAKSSGFVTSPFIIGASNKYLGVSIDGSDVYYIGLNEGTYGGDSLADEIQSKINEVPTLSGVWNSNDDALAFINSTVDYKNGKFYVISGNISEYYTGTSKSSVQITASGSDGLYSYLGFDLGFDSESLSSAGVVEVLVGSDYTAGTSTIIASSALGASAGDALMVTDGTYIDYFTALTVSGVNIGVAVSGVNGFDAISHNYTAGESKIQLLRPQDPEAEADNYFKKIDDVVRWGIMSISNQLDFSS